MSYVEAATSGYDLTLYTKRRIAKFIRDSESTKIKRDGTGYDIRIGTLKYPSEL